MFLSLTTVEAQPGQREKLLTVCKQTIQPTLAEPGCLGVRLYTDSEDDRIIVFVGNWENEDAWQRHMQTPRQNELADWSASDEGKDLMISWSARKLCEVIQS